jgi:NADPH2:quinone reductase
MKAVRVIPGGEGGRVELRDIPKPEVGPGQVLVRVRASGLNRGEITQARDLRSGPEITTGVEFAGEVAAVGAGVAGWREGDRVMGHGRNCQAEYVLAPPRALMRIPRGVSWVEAASFPNVFITAHDAIITNGELKRGESLLVNAASGGVAWAALQIGKLWGATPVIASSRSAEKLQKLTEYGVDLGIDASREDQVERVLQATDKRGVDVILDMVGGPLFEANIESLAVAGRLVQVARLGGAEARINLERIWLKRLKVIGVTFRTRSEEQRLACIEACARDLLPFLEEGRIRWALDRTFALDDVLDAHAYMMRAEHFGKIVLTLA